MMKISVLTTDTFLLTGLHEIMSDIPLNSINCGGHLMIVDLIHSVTMKASQYRSSCYIIFITDNNMIFRVNGDISFSCDTCCITRKCAVHELNTLVKKITKDIMQKKCFWRGVRNPLPALSETTPYLSLREKQVLPFIGQGDCDKKIARAIGCSAKTISTYRSTLLKKLNVSKVCGFLNFIRQYHALESLYQLQCLRESKYRPTITVLCRTIVLNEKQQGHF